MEKSHKRATCNRIEENTLAILESFSAHDSSDVHDDRLAFLEAVRFASIVPQNGTPPTNKMMEAIFGIMREAKSLELIVCSYQLLYELEKHFPRVCLSKGDDDDKEASGSETTDLVIFEEAWSPFAVGFDVGSSETRAANRGPKEPINATDFQLLLKSLSEVADETESFETKLKLVGKMFLLQYLIYILEGDLSPRIQNFQDNADWISVRDSVLNKLLGSRRINYKDLVKDCLFALCNFFPDHTSMDCDTEMSEGISIDINIDSALALSLPEVKKCTHKALQKLLLRMVGLDRLKKEADKKGFTTRADSVRTPVIEVIMDELSYDKDLISPFLQAFDEPTQKLEIVSQYIQKYNVKPTTRKRKSNGAQDEEAITRFFKCFLNITSTKGIVKKVGVEAVQVLLAHVLQVSLSMSKDQLHKVTVDLIDDAGGSPLPNICKNIISAFTKLRETDEYFQILPIGKEALFTAMTILSTKS